MYSIKEVYTLEDVVKALKANNELQYNVNDIDVLGCPTKVPHSYVHLLGCDGIPGECKTCQNQDCNQYLVVYCKVGGKPKLRILKFKFMIRIDIGSGFIISGFIPKEDSHLKQLIGKYIAI